MILKISRPKNLSILSCAQKDVLFPSLHCGSGLPLRWCILWLPFEMAHWKLQRWMDSIGHSSFQGKWWESPKREITAKKKNIYFDVVSQHPFVIKWAFLLLPLHDACTAQCTVSKNVPFLRIKIEELFWCQIFKIKLFLAQKFRNRQFFGANF